LTPIGLIKILQQAKTILVHMKHIHPSWVNAMFRNTKVRQTLRTIDVQRNYPEAVDKVGLDLHIVAKLFAINSVIMVDLESLAETEHIR
jgi:hypothetical protein